MPVVGHNTLDTLLQLYALFELGLPALLLHPRATVAEHAAETAVAAAAGPLPDGAAAVLFTSGTTGRARGAVLTRAAFAASAAAHAANVGWMPGDRWLLAMPVARIGGLSIVTRCLAARATLVLAPRFDAGALPGLIVRERITLLSLVPTMLTLTLDANPGWTAPPHLRTLLLGGSAASPRLFARARAAQLPVVVTYGCTETCSQVVATPYEARFDPAPWGCGTVLPGAELRADGERLQVRGAMRMHGYLGEPALDPEAWFDTGDHGCVHPDGHVELFGRRHDLIVSGGENVYPAEVERVLEALPGIAAAAVFGVADETWGQTVAAALVAVGRRPDDAVIVAHLAAQLARHKRPRSVVWVDALPVTSAGKPDRAAVAGLAPELRALKG
nr:AMP-binding protein [Rubrivivax gelatinosus]